MGLWLILSVSLFLAALVALMGFSLVWNGQHRQPPQLRRRRAATAAALPFLLLWWWVPANAAWQGWGWLTGLRTRFVLGAPQSVPLPNDYRLSAIDGEHHAVIYPPGGG